jgi:hypothetical protein
LYISKPKTSVSQTFRSSYFINFDVSVTNSIPFAENLDRERGMLLHQESEEVRDTRNLRDEDLRNLAQVCFALCSQLITW